jgi:predicted phosphodiesterase
MKIALISDIHANLQALEAVLFDIDLLGINRIYCLGDLVGYGPQPIECLDILIERNIPTVLGNHDAYVIGKLAENRFAEPNLSLLKYTRKILPDHQIKWLQSLPLVIDMQIKNMRMEQWNMTLAHATPINPESWEWLNSAILCREVLEASNSDIVIIGHTHIPSIIPLELGILGWQKHIKTLINPGSVGQSRDRDFRASYAIMDFDDYTCTLKRVAYDEYTLMEAYAGIGYAKRTIQKLR